MRRFALVLMIPIVLLLAIPVHAQTADQSGSAATGSSLEAEVAELKRLVAEHERRIAALEAALAKEAPETVAAGSAGDAADQAREPGSVPTAPGETGGPGESMESQPSAQEAAEVPRWAREASWRKLRLGMTEDEVLELLGPPDSTREIGFSRRLIYKGEVPGRSFLKGVVKLSAGAVSDLDLPDF